MPETSLVLSGQGVWQVIALGGLFLLALFSVIRNAVAAGLRRDRESVDAERPPASIDHYGG